MFRHTEQAGPTKPVLSTREQEHEAGRTPRPELVLPALNVDRTREERARQKQEVEALFPESTNLRGLISNIRSEHSEKFAEVIGSTDFAQERLAGLYADLERLAEQIEGKQITDSADVVIYVRNARNIHEVFEDLVIRCAQNSL